MDRQGQEKGQSLDSLDPNSDARSKGIRSRAKQRLSELSFKSEVLADDEVLFSNPPSGMSPKMASSSTAPGSTNMSITTTGEKASGLDGGDSLYQSTSVTELVDGMIGSSSNRTDYSCVFDDLSKNPSQKSIPTRKILSVLNPNGKFSPKRRPDSEDKFGSNGMETVEETADDLRKLPKVVLLREKIKVKKSTSMSRSDHDNDNDDNDIHNNILLSTMPMQNTESEEHNHPHNENEDDECVSDEETLVVVKEKHIWETLTEKQRATMFK